MFKISLHFISFFLYEYKAIQFKFVKIDGAAQKSFKPELISRFMCKGFLYLVFFR